MKAQKLFAVAIVSVAVAGVACTRAHSRISGLNAVTKKPAPSQPITNPHAENECPSLNGAWASSSDGRYEVSFDKEQNQITVKSEGEHFSSTDSVDGVIYNDNQAKTATQAYCSKGKLMFSFENSEMKLSLEMSADGDNKGKILASKTIFGQDGKAVGSAVAPWRDALVQSPTEQAKAPQAEDSGS
jgi:hypothetical protein